MRPIHGLVSLGGMAALSWEVVWQLQASLAFGVSALGTALTLAATMGGMAVGSYAAGWLLREGSLQQPLRAYGVLEAFIGVCGLLMLPGFALLEILDARVYALAPSLAPLLHALGIALLLAPPTCAMGATIPVFQLVARQHATRVSALYGWNTAGAAVGVLVLTFLLLPRLGVAMSCAVVASLNFAIFAIAFAAGPGSERARDAATGTGPTLAARIGPRLALALVFATGFVTFGLEVAWFRAMRSAFWSTSATFAILLAAVLVPLALGARAVPWMRRRGISPATALACAGSAILLATPLVERLDLAARVPGPYAAVVALWFLLCLAVVAPGLICLASALPWCLEEHPTPRMNGRLYASNTLGSVVGSLVAAWLLLPNLGFARSAWLLGALVFALAFTLAERRGRLLATVAAAASLTVAVLQSSSPGRDRPYGARSFKKIRLLDFDEGPDFTTSVVERANGLRLLLIDGFAASAESLVGGQYMYWMGSLPMLLHPRPLRGLVICFGTGRTANAVRNEGIARLDVVDVSAAVLGMAPHFRSNEAVLEDPRVETVVMDGRAWLRRTRARYDVITLEPMPPNFAGVNALYSREFYEIAASRLEPGGVVAQWLPFHLVSTEHAQAVAATFRAVFPDAMLWIEPYGGTGILLGRVQAGAEPLGSAWPGLSRAGWRPLDAESIRRGAFLSGEAFERYASGGVVISDDNQLLALSQLRPGLELELVLANGNYQHLMAVGGPLPFLTDREQYRAESDWWRDALRRGRRKGSADAAPERPREPPDAQRRRE